MRSGMQDSQKRQERSLTGLEYFRKAAEVFSRQPPSTYEEKLAQFKRNREQREKMESGRPSSNRPSEISE